MSLLENSESLNVFGRPEESISNFKSNRDMVYERIGYNPTPRVPL